MPEKIRLFYFSITRKCCEERQKNLWELLRLFPKNQLGLRTFSPNPALTKQRVPDQRQNRGLLDNFSNFLREGGGKNSSSIPCSIIEVTMGVSLVSRKPRTADGCRHFEIHAGNDPANVPLTKHSNF